MLVKSEILGFFFVYKEKIQTHPDLPWELHHLPPERRRRWSLVAYSPTLSLREYL